MDAVTRLKQAFHMSEGTLGAVIAAGRKAKGLSRKELGEKFSVSEQAVGQWERNETRPTNARVIAICRELEIDPYAAERGELVGSENPAFAPADASTPVEVGHLQPGPKEVEVLGVAVGGDESSFYFNGTVSNMVARPPGLRRAARVFALNIVGESVIPRYYPGELVYCQDAAASPGEYVVVELYPEDDGSPGKSFVKRLVKRSGSKLICEQHNPPKTIEYPLGEVKSVYRIIPTRELMGG